MTRISSRLKAVILIISVAALALSALLLVDRIIQTPSENQTLYAKAINDCNSEIWLVYEDIGPVLPQKPINKPFPRKISDVIGDRTFYGYGCSHDDALKIQTKYQ